MRVQWNEGILAFGRVRSLIKAPSAVEFLLGPSRSDYLRSAELLIDADRRSEGRFET